VNPANKERILWRQHHRPLSELDDPELVARFLDERSEKVFRELYRRHTPLIYRTSLRLLPATPGAAEDATQECWLRAIRGLAGFRWQSRLSTWLAGIAIRTCAELARASAAVLDLEDYRDELIAPDEELRLDALDLERLLHQVAPGYRAVLVLHDLEGFTHEETAQALDIEPGTAKSQLSRGRRALRALAAQPAHFKGRTAP
jgi:RNA polymerase sigma-70 factor (ECF subfamily)